MLVLVGDGPRKSEPAWLVRVLKGDAKASTPNPPSPPTIGQAAAKTEEELAAYLREEAKAIVARKRGEELRRNETQQAEDAARRLELQKVCDEVASELPRPIVFYPDHRATEKKIRELETLIAVNAEPSLVAQLANVYGRCGYAVFDLKSSMSDHPEEAARRWPLACGHPIEAWLRCPRADWLAWSCAKSRGWGYPGLWRAAIDSVQAALDATAGGHALEDVRLKVVDWLKRLRHSEKIFFLGQARLVAQDLFEIHEACLDELDRIDGDLDVEDLPTYLAQHLAEACADLATPRESFDHEPQLEVFVHAALILARVKPAFETPPDWWGTDLDADTRGIAWEDGDRWGFEVKAKLEDLAEVVRRRIPVPIDPSA